MGGCVSSRSEFPNSIHPNIFTVYPVTRSASADAIEGNGTRSSSRATGQLQVTSNELILHRPRHEPVRWPLQYVRRYGYENNLFSFESGRRCESGPGIFTFRCRRAQDLFLMVQANVQEARTPPPSATQRLDRLMERGRSGSVPSQSQLPKEYAAAGGVDVSHGTTSSGRRINSTASDSFVTGIQDPTIGFRPFSPLENARETIRETATAEQDPDEADGGQVFMELGAEAPSAQHRFQRLPALSNTRSEASSESSGRLSLRPSSGRRSSMRRRPLSFECVSPGAFSSPAEGENSAFISPRDEACATQLESPVRTPALYYVNVDPAAQPIDQRGHRPQLYQNKLLSSIRKAPARSQSLGSSSPPTSSIRYVSSTRKPCDYDDVKSNSASPSLRKSRVISDQATGKAPDNVGTLHYITVDVGRNLMMNGRNTMPSSFGKRYGGIIMKPNSLFATGQSLNSVSEDGSNSSLHRLAYLDGKNPTEKLETADNDRLGSAGNGRMIGPRSATLHPSWTTTSNYAHIDCARTKALQATAAVAQLQRRSASCSASSSEAVETGPVTTIAHWRRRDGYSIFGRRKHNSGNVLR